MPYFTPDVERFAIGRPYATWWVKLIDDCHWLCFKDAKSEPVKLYAPFQEELDEYEYTFDSGRETFVSYQQVRDMELTKYGRVFYRDDYDVQYTDQYVARPQPGKDYNKPFDRAVVPEPIWYPVPPPVEFVLNVGVSVGSVEFTWDLEPAGYFHDTRLVIRDQTGTIVYDREQKDGHEEVTLDDQVIKPWRHHKAQAITKWYDGTEYISNEVTFLMPAKPEPPWALAVYAGTTPSTTNVQLDFSYGDYYNQREQEITEWIGQYSMDGSTWTNWTTKKADGFSTGPLVYDFTSKPLPIDAIVFFRIIAKSPYGQTPSEFIPVDIPWTPGTCYLDEVDEEAEIADFRWEYNISYRDRIIDQDLVVKYSNGNVIGNFDFDEARRQHKIDMIDDTDGLIAWYRYYATLTATVISGETGEQYTIKSNVVEFRFTTSPELPMYVDTSSQFPPIPTRVWILWTEGFYFSEWQQEIQYYTIHRSDDDMATWQEVGRVNARGSTQFEYKPPVPFEKGKVYYFSVRAYNAWGMSDSALAQPPDVYLLYFPKGPVNINLKVDFTYRQTCNVDWTVDSTEFTKQELIVDGQAQAIPVTDRTAFFGAPYFVDRKVKVRVTQPNGDTYESNEITVNVPNWPNEPTNVRFVGPQSLTGLTLDFDQVDPIKQKVTKFVAQYTDYPPSGNWKDCGTELNPTKTDVNCTFNPPLRLGMNYWFRVVAYNDYGQQASDGKLTWNAR